MVRKADAMTSPTPPGFDLTPQQRKSRRARNIAIALIVTALVVLVYALTIAKLGGHVGDRAL